MGQNSLTNEIVVSSSKFLPTMLPTPSAVTCLLCHATVSVRGGNKERFLSHLSHDHEAHYDRELLYALSFMTEQEKQTVMNIMDKRMSGTEEVGETEDSKVAEGEALAVISLDESVILDTSISNTETTETPEPIPITNTTVEENVVKTERPVKTERKQSSRSQCPKCELMVPKKTLKIHLKLKHKTPSVGLSGRYTSCKFCDKMMRKDSLGRHLRQVHRSSKEDHETMARREAETDDSQAATKIKTEVMEEVTGATGDAGAVTQTEAKPTPSHSGELEGKKQRKCKICFKTVRMTWYSRHLKEKHSGIIHKCKLCHVRLVRKQYVKKHMEAQHKNDKHLLDSMMNPTFSKSDCKFECPECKIKLITAEILEFHVAKSHGTGAEQCGNCERRFKNKTNLKNHQEKCNVLSVSMP